MSLAANSKTQDSLLDEQRLKKAFGSFATGVSVITALKGDGQAVGLTVNSLSSVSMHPPLLLWCLNIRSPNLAVFVQAKHHGISILTQDQELAARQFASKHEDKFLVAPNYRGIFGVPLLSEAMASFECSHVKNYEAGDHVIFICQVENTELNSNNVKPLVFHRSRFVALSE
jgi:flavin reductase (DIM6/NTAB) family NADH-FMN oxidoreductase RutF